MTAKRLALMTAKPHGAKLDEGSALLPAARCQLSFPMLYAGCPLIFYPRLASLASLLTNPCIWQCHQDAYLLQYYLLEREERI